MSALSPIPQDCVTQGNVTPAMRQWMLNSLVDAIGFDNAITALQAARAPRNLVLNGDFAVWQRGTSFAGASGNKWADRWGASRFGALNYSMSQQIGGGPAGFQFYGRLKRTAGDTGLTSIYLYQNMETRDSIPLAGSVVTFSAWVRSGANFSATGANLHVGINTGTGTDQNIAIGYTGLTTPGLAEKVITTGWTRVSVTATIPANATEICPFIGWTPTGTAGANDYIDVTGLQLEFGSAPTAFDYRPFGEQLARCQRYYQKSFPYAVTPAQNAGTAGVCGYVTTAAGASGNYGSSFAYPTRLRVNPAMTFYNPSAANAFAMNVITGTSGAATTTTGFSSDSTFHCYTVGVAGWAVGQLIGVHWTADAEL